MNGCRTSLATGRRIGPFPRESDEKMIVPKEE